MIVEVVISVVIARALASDAKIILADKPTGNMDIRNNQMIIDLLEVCFWLAYDICGLVEGQVMKSGRKASLRKIRLVLAGRMYCIKIILKSLVELC